MTITETIAFINLGITVLGGATAFGAHLMAVRDLTARIKKTEERMDALNDHGGEHGRHTRFLIDLVTNRLGKMELNGEATAKAVQEITADVRIISEWVSQQREKRQ